YTDAVDNELRELFGFAPPLEEPEEEEMPPGAEAQPHAPPEHAPAPEAAPAPAEPAPPTPAEPTAPAAPPAPAPGPPQSSLDRAPFAVLLVAGKPRSLENWIPSREELLEYLPRVGDLLGTTALRTQRKKVLAGSYATLFRNLVLTTAWQESCWRQFVRKGGAVQPLTSSVGAVGIMQVNPHVWRGFYDVKALRSSTKYNAEAGSEILHHYLVDYALT